MAIYRGTGGAGDSTTDATVSDVTEQATIASTKASEAAASATNAATSASQAASSATSAANSAANAATAAASVTTDAAAAEAAKLAAQAAQAAAELAETGAETAETNAETANTNAASSANSASTSATNAANSASSAATSASNASTSASAAATSATDASTSASSAATSATSAATSAGTATTQATAAAASATSASNSATAAASSASAASTSATNAATSETNAATSATNASTSETNASASETAAAGSATSASTSASNAATSATSASNSASAASTSATNAAASETNAATSETNAAASASAASTSATNAAASESAAATSATSAATSASTATTQAGLASTSASNAATSETNAATSASNAASSATAAASSASSASTSASSAATSATNAAASETAAAGSASAASASADAALAALDSFDDRYLGQKASAPTVDNDGDPLVTGALYFDTTDDAMKVWDGTQWLNAYASLSGALIATNNLSDLTNAATARTNLGLGTAATTDSTAYATAAQGALADSALQSGDNISELTNNSGYITGNQTITLSGDVSGSGTTSIVVTVADDSHNHIISNVDGLQAALDGKVDDSQVLTNVPSGAVFTDTTYSVGNGGLTEINFTSALNSKLAGIEAGATADQTASEILTAIKTVDGSGSGLDADLLDGQHGTYYAAASSLSNYLPRANNNDHQLQVWDNRNTDTSTDLGNRAVTFEFKGNATDSLSDGGTYHGVMTFQQWNDSSGGSTYQLGFTVNNNLWLRSTAIGGTWPTTWSKVWTSTNDGAGSGLDADLLDGQQGSYYAAASSLSNYLPLTGGTMTGSVTMNDTLLFGTSFNEWMFQRGNMKLRSDGNYAYFSGANGFYMAGFSNLYAGGLAAEFNTVTADGLTVDGSEIVVGRNSASNTGYKLEGTSTNASCRNWDIRANHLAFGDLVFRQGASQGANPSVIRQRIDVNGDISFYEDTGTTAKFFWDASAESLGIGTSSPSSTYGVDSTKGIRITSTVPAVTLQESDASSHQWQLGSYGGNFSIRDVTHASYPFTVAEGGNVGIGTASPAAKLDVNGTLAISGSTGTSGQVLTSNGASAPSWQTFSGGTAQTASVGASGWWKCNDTGLIIQWGVTGSIAANGNTTVTLPLTMPTAVRTIYATRNEASIVSSDEGHINCVIISASQIRLYNSASGTANAVFWMVIGN